MENGNIHRYDIRYGNLFSHCSCYSKKFSLCLLLLSSLAGNVEKPDKIKVF